MGKGNEPAYPVSGGDPAYPVSTCFNPSSGQLGHQDGPNTYQYPGMNLRQHYAGLAMQCVLSCESAMNICDESAEVLGLTRAEWVANESVQLADALLAALERSHDGG